jgi:glycosyltransferase involved in cell wall biosynthesis
MLVAKPRTLLISYPNFPFFPREMSQPFGLSTILLLLLSLIKRITGMQIIVDADDVPGLELEAYSRVEERRGTLDKDHILFFERAIFHMADLVWVVSKEGAEWIRERCNMDKRKFLVVPNGNLRLQLAPRDLPRDRVKFVYAGSLFRDVDEIRHLLDIFVRSASSTIELYLMGVGGQWISREYKSPNISYLGSLAHQEAEQYVKACDVGVLLYAAEEKFFDIAFPVKLALYITCEIPILSSDSPGIKAFIERHQIGMISSPSSFENAVYEIAHRADLREIFKANCKKIKNNYYVDTIFEQAIRSSADRLLNS